MGEMNNRISIKLLSLSWFAHLQDLICLNIGQFLDLLAGPLDFDALNGRGFAQTEVDAPIALHDETKRAAGLGDVGLTLRRDGDMSSETVSVAASPFEIQH